MIKVNWKKIRPFEKKSFAFITMVVLCLVGLFVLAFEFKSVGYTALVKAASAAVLTATVGLLVHIESRMLQIYFLQAVYDITALVLCSVKRNIFAVLIAAAVILMLTSLFLAILKKWLEKGTMYEFPEADRSNIFGGRNVILFAPHEDDEINLYAGIIEQYVKNGSTVRIVFSTNGDLYGIGKTRLKEALRVAKRYSIPKENIIFLGYGNSINGKDGKHVYNCPENEIIPTEKEGITDTYGLKDHAPFLHRSYTRKNIAGDFEAVIRKFMPDTIFSCDFDSHPDHRAIGLFFEEALDKILKSDSAYCPKVYKSFAYSLSWEGKADFYMLNMQSTKRKSQGEVMSENNVYKWNERVRLPVCKSNLSRIMQNASSYKAMTEYSSQTASDHATGVLNNDKVFWERRTDSVLYNAKITSSSGDASEVCSFKLVDCEDLNNPSLLPCANVWTAEENDSKCTLTLNIGEKKTICELVIYPSPEPKNNIINSEVTIGAYTLSTGRLSKGPNRFEIPCVEADKIKVRVSEYEGECSLLKIEAFEKAEAKEAQIVKIINSTDDFCFDYIIDHSGSEAFGIYTYPSKASDSFEVKASGKLDFDFSNGLINVRCEKGNEGILKVCSKENPFIYDEIRISNPDESLRKELLRKQSAERKLFTFPMQKDYYVGLIRRLGVYK